MERIDTAVNKFMCAAYEVYAQGIFDDPDEDITAKDIVAAVEVGQNLGLDFWNPKDVPSTRFERDRLRKMIGSKGKDIEDA